MTRTQTLAIGAALAIAASSVAVPDLTWTTRRDQPRPSSTHKPAKRRAAKKIKKASQKRNRK